MQNIDYHFKIEYPPTINHYYQTNKHSNKKFINKDAKRYIERNTYTIKQRMNDLDIQTIVNPLTIYLYIYLPDERIRDKDNILKCIFDTIKLSGLVKDDSQLKDVFVHDQGLLKNKECVIFNIVTHSKVDLPESIYNYYFM